MPNFTLHFRAWDKELARMRPVIQMNLSDGGVLVPDDGDNRAWLLFEQVQVMQYTGFQDHAGRSIYEGDIIRVDWKEEGDRSEGRSGRDGSFEDIVKWEYTGWSDSLSYCDQTGCKVTVIGNIYENPDLLKNIQDYDARIRDDCASVKN